MKTGITITVEGFKSIRDKIDLELAPLTVLAGANSSGKTSSIQPLLLVKQTIESPFDAGPLRISGDNVSFNHVDQMFWKGPRGIGKRFSLAVRDWQGFQKTVFSRSGAKGLFDKKLILASCASRLIHVPGLRGQPQRYYPITNVSRAFPGLFPPYTASIIKGWMDVDDERLSTLNEWLSRLELTGSVTAARVDDANVEVRVARTRNGRPRKADMIGLADVGLGVSQVLPVLVAILVASKGRIVYVEQPELHLHPRAQVKLAEILCEAARPDVYVLIETHSGLLLRGIQEAVARARVSPEKIRLHWFHRDKLGVTRVSSATLDARGRFGDWPVDFGDVELDIEDRFLRASLGASKK